MPLSFLSTGGSIVPDARLMRPTCVTTSMMSVPFPLSLCGILALRLPREVRDHVIREKPLGARADHDARNVHLLDRAHANAKPHRDVLDAQDRARRVGDARHFDWLPCFHQTAAASASACASGSHFGCWFFM